MTTVNSLHGVGDPAINLPGIPATCDPQPVIAQMVRRASSIGYESWWRRAQSVGYCAHPIQLVGTDHYGRDKIVWARCNNRRASVCPSCSDLYARDTWQLVAAGTAGGRHGISPDVADRPQVFATVTAPSFGAVHASTGGTCREYRRIGEFRRCPHGKPLWCTDNHDHTDVLVGQPLCRECYDYTAHVLFTWHLPELWRRFTITLRRNVAKKLKSAGVEPKSVRISFVKVVEMQARAVPHIHALIRLDPAIPATDTVTTAPGDHEDYGPAATGGGREHRCGTDFRWESPITAGELAALIQSAARSVHLDVPDPTATDTEPATVRFGGQIDTQPLSAQAVDGQSGSEKNDASASRLSPHRVAGYLAKYVTKSLADFGISARRLSTEAIADLDVSEHIRAILTTVGDLSNRARCNGITALVGVGRWLHTLGYRGHITTKSRRYSTTMGALRSLRAVWTREQAAEHRAPQDGPEIDLTTDSEPLWWEFDRAGHATPGDRTLVVSAALRHIDTRRTGLAECRALSDRQPPGAGDG
ncbi:plasmid replication initiator protein [Mycobacteroides abscessus]|nr:plasmid replication initiator protein [Mycobacteroides abscessus]MCA4767256.1 plasmid replication initiator protein [Mycobacteroides abscessus]UBV08843.1 plasmid replication initiator protein [Mycobacteroides abscessus]UBV26035.1 plasmid replication initiator protein [Mycobacteroides abscessus]